MKAVRHELPHHSFLANIIMKTALVTGCTGQAANYLIPLLISKGYRVVGFSPRRSTYSRPCPNLRDRADFVCHPGDVTDSHFIDRLFCLYEFSEVYNLAAMSFVGSSWEQPQLVHDVIVKGTLNLLEAVRRQPCENVQPRLYQASSSEMFGSSVDPDGFQRETTPFKPNSPYAVAKLAAHHLCRVYRDSYNVQVSCGILFNNESPYRGREFVTRKVSHYVASLVNYFRNNSSHPGKLTLGNFQAKRDWGFTGDYVRAMHLMLQHSPDDFVVATGRTWSVQELVEQAFLAGSDLLGKSLNWREHVVSDPGLLRPLEVPHLLGDASRARRVLGWEPEVQFPQLVKMMVEADVG